MLWKHYSLLNIAEWSSGSSAGSLPEGRMFESSLRNYMAGVAEWIGKFEMTQYDYHAGSTPAAGPKIITGVVAQMDRASALQAEGREFDSHLLHLRPKYKVTKTRST